MGQALYRKYRSKSLSEIIGQEHITTALQHALDEGRLSHAYLFTGPRGIGKTSIARILAQQMNGLPYTGEPQLDIIEIDAASNRRIDEIRDLRDKVYIAPTSAKYKVYIIDEVHMLTREAFNALLKTLEEPPEHVVFILATTDAHKLPETIISRTQRYSFRPVETAKVAKHLADIAKKESIDIDDDALTLLAEHGEGSFRDSISMLDQVSNQANKVSADDVRQQLGILPEAAVLSLLDSLQSSDASVPILTLQTLYDQGFRANTIAEQLARQLRSQLTGGRGVLPADQTLSLLKRLLEVANAHSPERYLELVLLESLPAGEQSAIKQKPAPAPVAAAPITEEAPQKPAEKKVEKVEPLPEPESKPKKKTTASSTGITDENWTAVLAALKKQYNTIYGIVRMAHTDFSETGKVQLGFAFAFHQKRISDPKNRKIVADIIDEVTGQQVELVCVVSKEPKPRSGSTTQAGNTLQDISSVFGGGELV